MLASEHEAILQRSKSEGTGRHRPQSAKGRGRKDLLGVGANHQALYLKRRRETGDVEPKPIPGRSRLKGAALEEWLPSHLENNDLTLEEHRQAFEEAHSGVRVSNATVGRAIARLPGGWPLKKSRR
jgi:transposase